MSKKQLLFSYGTLQDQSIQMKLFGRKLQGSTDSLEGFKMEYIDLNTPDSEWNARFVYPIAIPTNSSEDCIEGVVYEVSTDDLKIADTYEGSSYRRIEFVLKSGRTCWFYQQA